MNFDTTIDVDLDDVKDFCKNKLANFLVENTTDIRTAIFILQAVIDHVNKLENQ